MTQRTEHTPRQESAQGTASSYSSPKTEDHKRPVTQDSREVKFYHSDLRDDILENPALYMGPADF